MKKQLRTELDRIGEKLKELRNQLEQKNEELATLELDNKNLQSKMEQIVKVGIGIICN